MRSVGVLVSGGYKRTCIPVNVQGNAKEALKTGEEIKPVEGRVY